VQIRERRAQPVLPFRVQAAAGSSKKQSGRGEQGARDGQALAHAARKCSHQVVGAARQTDGLERLARSRRIRASRTIWRRK
jgi:hypothetical protein